MKDKLVGWDMDGTLCRYDGTFGYWLFAVNKTLGAWWQHFFSRPLWLPTSGDVIITGRPYADQWITRLWLRWWRVEGVLVFYNPGSPMQYKEIVEHKAHTINQLRVSLYHENDPLQVAYLRLHCPETKVRLADERAAA